jgi:uncharacterized protein (DUF697 family)
VIGNLAQFWKLTRELDLGSIRADFERDVRVDVLGSDRASAETVARLFEPEALGTALHVGVLGEWPVGRDRSAVTDLTIGVIGGPLEQAARRALTELSIGDTTYLLVQLGERADLVIVGVPEERMLSLDPDSGEEALRERLFGALVSAAPEAMLPLGRRFPSVREAVATHLVRDAARVNAQFAALSSVPSFVPVVGGLVGDVADMLVLTKNQVVLLFKLAGLYGRDLKLGQTLLAEVAPVVGSAFLWRSSARALVGLLPGVVSLVPKVAVAYSGTFVVGEMARYYYRYGRKPPADYIKHLQRESARLARTAMERLNIGSGADKPGG